MSIIIMDWDDYNEYIHDDKPDVFIVDTNEVHNFHVIYKGRFIVKDKTLSTAYDNAKAISKAFG